MYIIGVIDLWHGTEIYQGLGGIGCCILHSWTVRVNGASPRKPHSNEGTEDITRHCQINCADMIQK